MKYLTVVIVLAVVLYAVAAAGDPDLKGFVLWALLGVALPAAVAVGVFLALVYWLFSRAQKEL